MPVCEETQKKDEVIISQAIIPDSPLPRTTEGRAESVMRIRLALIRSLFVHQTVRVSPTALSAHRLFVQSGLILHCTLSLPGRQQGRRGVALHRRLLDLAADDAALEHRGVVLLLQKHRRRSAQLAKGVLPSPQQRIGCRTERPLHAPDLALPQRERPLRRRAKDVNVQTQTPLHHDQDVAICAPSQCGRRDAEAETTYLPWGQSSGLRRRTCPHKSDHIEQGIAPFLFCLRTRQSNDSLAHFEDVRQCSHTGNTHSASQRLSGRRTDVKGCRNRFWKRCSNSNNSQSS